MKEKMKSKVFVIAFLILLVMPIMIENAFAAINFNLSSPQSFGPGQVIDAIVNLSLENVPANTQVKITITAPNYNKEVVMNLLQFLERLNAQKECMPANCLTTYATQGVGLSEKTLNMQAAQESLIAFKIPSGSNIEIKDFSFKIVGSTSGGFSCDDSIIKFDLLDDGSIDWEYAKPTEEKNCSDFIGGCFANINTQDLVLDSTPRCEKIKIGKTGKADLGVYVNLVGDSGNLLLLLYDPVTQRQYNCTVEAAESGFNFCSISYEDGFFINSSRDVFVCVKAVSGHYTIKVETDSPCGFFGNPQEQPSFNSDYPLYLRYYGFSSMDEEFVFSNNTFIGNLKEYLQQYIDSRYSRNCNNNGCVIPLRFVANEMQTLTLSEPSLKYSHTLGSAFNNYFYDVTASYAKINVSQQLSLTALNITAPEVEGNYVLKLTIGSSSRQTSFKVEQVPIVLSVSPSVVIPGIETTFYVTVQQVANPIVDYSWDWEGDGIVDIVTTQPQANHTYAAGTYTLIVTVKDAAGLQGSKAFTIISNVTRDLLNTTINDLISRINALSLQYNSLEPWYRELLGLNLTRDNATLFTLKTQISTVPESQFLAIKQTLDEIASRNPISIIDSFKLAESFYYPDPEHIDPVYVSEITHESYNRSNEEQYKNAIALWQEKNLDVKIHGSVKAFVYETKQEDKLTIINIKLNPRTSLDNVYLIFSLPSGVSYSSVAIKEGNFEKENLGDAIGFSFSSLRASETISIAIPSKQDLMQLKFYVSPSLAELNIETVSREKKEGNKSMIFFIIILVVAIVIGLFLIWSKKGKENLFKSETDLISLINFISMSLAQGMPRKQIEEQLLNAGWSKKQINYAFKQVERPSKFPRF
ncbi:MAG: PKD domain-containing protein [Candidatus Pacearchaeota archaeon]